MTCKLSFQREKKKKTLQDDPKVSLLTIPVRVLASIVIKRVSKCYDPLILYLIMLYLFLLFLALEFVFLHIFLALVLTRESGPDKIWYWLKPLIIGTCAHNHFEENDTKLLEKHGLYRIQNTSSRKLMNLLYSQLITCTI